MTIEVFMRRPQPSEYNSLQALIETVANETFKDLFAPNPVPLKFEDEDWPLAWVGVSHEKIVGVILTNQEWVSDLWVFREHRRQGVGTRLLDGGSKIRIERCASGAVKAWPCLHDCKERDRIAAS